MEPKVPRTKWACFVKPRILATILLLAFLPGFTAGQTWKWTTETVDAFGVQTSIAVDENQNLHISYFSGVVKYGFRPADSSRWFTMDIAPGGGYSEVFTRLVLDPEGNPQICFTPGVLKYASFEHHKWNIQEVNPQSGLIEYTCSLAVGADGTRHVLWYQYGGPDGGYFLHVKHAALQNGAWMARTIDFDGQSGKWNSLALDSQGNPHVTYDSFLIGQLKYASWDGKEWKRTVVDSPSISPNGSNSHGLGSSLVLNGNGKAQISYEEDNSVKYAWEKDSSWKIDVVDNVSLKSSNWSWVGYRTRQALDPQGNPHIVYEDDGAVKHAYWDGSNWRIQVVSGAGPKRYRYENIAIDHKGNIYISYQDAFDGSVKVSIGRLEAPAENSSDQKKPKE